MTTRAQALRARAHREGLQKLTSYGRDRQPTEGILQYAQCATAGGLLLINNTLCIESEPHMRTNVYIAVGLCAASFAKLLKHRTRLQIFVAVRDSFKFIDILRVCDRV